MAIDSNSGRCSQGLTKRPPGPITQRTNFKVATTNAHQEVSTTPRNDHFSRHKKRLLEDGYFVKGVKSQSDHILPAKDILTRTLKANNGLSNWIGLAAENVAFVGGQVHPSKNGKCAPYSGEAIAFAVRMTGKDGEKYFGLGHAPIQALVRASPLHSDALQDMDGVAGITSGSGGGYNSSNSYLTANSAFGNGRKSEENENSPKRDRSDDDPSNQDPKRTKGDPNEDDQEWYSCQMLYLGEEHESCWKKFRYFSRLLTHIEKIHKKFPCVGHNVLFTDEMERMAHEKSADKKICTNVKASHRRWKTLFVLLGGNEKDYKDDFPFHYPNKSLTRAPPALRSNVSVQDQVARNYFDGAQSADVSRTSRPVDAAHREQAESEPLQQAARDSVNSGPLQNTEQGLQPGEIGRVFSMLHGIFNEVHDLKKSANETRENLDFIKRSLAETQSNTGELLKQILQLVVKQTGEPNIPDSGFGSDPPPTQDNRPLDFNNSNRFFNEIFTATQSSMHTGDGLQYPSYQNPTTGQQIRSVPLNFQAAATGLRNNYDTENSFVDPSEIEGLRNPMSPTYHQNPGQVPLTANMDPSMIFERNTQTFPMVSGNQGRLPTNQSMGNPNFSNPNFTSHTS